MRVEFNNSIKQEIARRAMHLCTNPECLRFTIYSTTEKNARSLAQAAHINAASEDGPRAKAIDKEFLESADNGIWLCSGCHKKVDDDPSYYTVEMLNIWKCDHEDILRRIVGKDLEAVILDLQNNKRYHQEAKEFVSFVES